MVVKKKKKKTATKAKTTKQAASRKAKTTRTGSTVTIRYRCDGVNCNPNPDPAHMAKGDTAVMKATNTAARIHFFGKSPFKKKLFNIAKGTSVSAEVIKSSGHFRYTLTCPGCGGSSVPPEFIVP